MRKLKSLKEFKIHCPEEYNDASNQGFLELICNEMGWEIFSYDFKPCNYWTLERCREEALKYQSKTQWLNSSRKSYYYTKKNNWFDLCCVHMIKPINKSPRNYWTLERCKEEALKYQSKTQWRINHSPSHYHAKKNNWFDLCCVHMLKLTKIINKSPRNHWTLERCKEEALKYQSKYQWQKNSSSSYNRAIKNNWINECTTHMKRRNLNPSGYFSFEKCLEMALNYKKVSDWRANDYNSYVAAHKHGFYDKCALHLERRMKNIWTLETCIFEANKFNNKKAWYSTNSSSYNAARNNGWLAECIKSYPTKLPKLPKLLKTSKDFKCKIKNKLTFIKCVRLSSEFKTQRDWKLYNLDSYNKAKNKKWIVMYADVFPQKHIKILKWNKEACLNVAKNFPSKNKWNNFNQHSFRSAKRNGWMDECTAHMVPYIQPIKKEKPIKVKKEKPIKVKKILNPNIKPAGYWTFERCKEEALKYQSKTQWRKNNRGSYGATERNNWFDECCKHMTTSIYWK